MHIYEVHTINFQTFSYGHLKLLKTPENSVCYYYTSYKMIDQFSWFQVQINSYISNWIDCHSWWISKMKSDTWEERYAIKFNFKLGKMPQKCMECFILLFDHLAWIEYQFLSEIRDSRKAGILWGMMRGVGGVRESIYQSWLAKGLGLGLLCWGFMGVQEEISPEEASTLKIRSVAFRPEQYTSP